VQIRKPAHVDVDRRHRMAALEEQPGVPPTSARQIEHRRPLPHERRKPHDPGEG
jgi:hypothetical protein